jgi:hypothetical protein
MKVMTSLADLFERGAPALPALTERLDGLSPEDRVLAIRSLTRRQQAALFEAAAGYRPISLLDIVPAETPPMQEVVHHGKNSLPAFRTFAKVFCRPEKDKDEGALWGYNRSGAFIGAVVGPGYFLTRQHGAGEVLVDYLEVPPARPAGWPEILPNSARLSRVVYYQTQDVLRGVSRHVTIGRASRKGKAMDAWFVLCRE